MLPRRAGPHARDLSRRRSPHPLRVSAAARGSAKIARWPPPDALPRPRAAVATLQPGESAERGREARRTCAPLRARRVGPGAGPPRPGRGARGPGRHARAGARPDPLRADARVAVHLLPRRGRASWPPTWRRRRTRASRCRPAATRTSRTSAASRRRTAGSSSAPTTSTRRCPGRGSGTSSGWRPAPRSPAATSGSPGTGGARSCRLRARVPRGHAGLRGREPPRRLVRPPHRERARRALRRPARAEGPARVLQPFARARRKTSLRAVRKLTERVDGELRFRSVPPLLVPFRELFDPGGAHDEAEFVQRLLDQYAAGLDPDRRFLFQTYRFVDLARKVVGVGSVGTRAWIVLLVGRDGRDPLVLQAKEAGRRCSRPTWAPARSTTTASASSRASGSRTRPATSSSAGSAARASTAQEHDFYVRQLWDWKASADLSALSAAGLHAYTRACGWSLARAHARSGDRLAIAAYLGAGARFDRAIARFAAAYADQNERDHARLAEAVAAGEVRGRARRVSDRPPARPSVGEPDPAVEAGRRVEVEHPHRLAPCRCGSRAPRRAARGRRPRAARAPPRRRTVKVSSPSRM